MSAPNHPGAIDVNGLPYLRDAKGNLVPLSAVKPADLLMDETVRKILADARVYWDNTNKVVTATAGSNTLIGVATLAALAATPTVHVRLNASF